MDSSPTTRRTLFGAAGLAASAAAFGAQAQSPAPAAGRKSWSALTEPELHGSKTVLKVDWVLAGDGAPPPSGYLGQDHAITPSPQDALDVSPMVERAEGRPGAVPRSIHSIAREMWVTPEDFGAERKPLSQGGDDGPAIQAMLDWVRLLTPEGSNREAQMVAARLNPGGYCTRQSLDFGGTGARYGFSLTGGGGGFQTTLYAQLDEPYPVLDCCNVAGLRLSRFAIRSGALCRSTAGILIARSTDAVFHNWGPVLEDMMVEASGPNCVGAIVCQDADVLDLVRTGAVCNSGGAGLILGNELPLLHHGQCRPGSGPDALAMAAGAPGGGQALVGKRVKIFAGAGREEVSTITAYDAATATARVSPPWATPPDGTSRFAVLALTSKFRPLGGTHSTTLLTVSGKWGGAGYTGNPAIVWTGGDRLVLSDVYAASGPMGSKPPVSATIVVDAPTWPNTMILEGRGLRTENQVPNGPTISAVHVANGAMQMIDINGELETGTPGKVNNDIGIIRATGQASIGVVRLSGRVSYADTPLFYIDNDLVSVEVVLNFHNLGKISAEYGKFDNLYDRPGLLDEAAQAVRQGFYRGIAIGGRRSRLAGLQGAVSNVLELQDFVPQRSATTGGSAQRRLRWTIPASALGSKLGEASCRFDGKFVGVCRAKAVLGVQLSQTGSRAVQSQIQGGPISAGGAWRLEAQILRLGAGWTWSWALWDGVEMRAQGAQALPAFDPAAPLNLDLLETAQAPNALDVLTFSGQVC